MSRNTQKSDGLVHRMLIISGKPYILLIVSIFCSYLIVRLYSNSNEFEFEKRNAKEIKRHMIVSIDDLETTNKALKFQLEGLTSQSKEKIEEITLIKTELTNKDAIIKKEMELRLQNENEYAEIIYEYELSKSQQHNELEAIQKKIALTYNELNQIKKSKEELNMLLQQLKIQNNQLKLELKSSNKLLNDKMEELKTDERNPIQNEVKQTIDETKTDLKVENEIKLNNNEITTIKMSEKNYSKEKENNNLGYEKQIVSQTGNNPDVKDKQVENGEQNYDDKDGDDDDDDYESYSGDEDEDYDYDEDDYDYDEDKYDDDDENTVEEKLYNNSSTTENGAVL